MGHRRDEFAVIGLGRFGSAVALSLEAEGHHVLGIDQDMEIVQALSAQLTHCLSLDSTDEAALKSIDIDHFRAVVVAIGTDFESNLLTVVALKNLGVKHVISKTMTHRQGEILRKVGADRTILPEHDAGQRLAEALINPDLLERFALGPGYSIAELVVPHRFANQTLDQLGLRRKYSVTVLVVKRGDRVFTGPGADFILLDKDVLVLLGEDDTIEALSHLDD